jgi:hypothetical protein
MQFRQWIQHTGEHAPSSHTEHRATKATEELGFDEPILRGGYRKQSKQSSFAQFFVTAKPDDEWPYVFVGPSRRPVSAIEAFIVTDAEQIVECEMALPQ